MFDGFKVPKAKENCEVSHGEVVKDTLDAKSTKSTEPDADEDSTSTIVENKKPKPSPAESLKQIPLPYKGTKYSLLRVILAKLVDGFMITCVNPRFALSLCIIPF